MNCWDTAKTRELQRRDEIGSSVNAENFSLGGNQQPSIEQMKVQRLSVGSSGPKCVTPVRDEDIVWSVRKLAAACGIIGQIQQHESPRMIPDILTKRFAEKYEIDSSSGCWNWTASTAGKGYGQIKIPGQRRQIYAHRLSYLIHNGEIPEGLVVCHTCDNPRCVNPNHLFVGTIRDNLIDMKNKDRHLRGERNTQSKLTESDVIKMYQMRFAGKSTYAIADTFGVGQMTVWRIVNGKRWKHVQKRCQVSDLA